MCFYKNAFKKVVIILGIIDVAGVLMGDIMAVQRYHQLNREEHKAHRR